MTKEKALSEKEHKIILENTFILEEKINHPVELGESQLKNIILCMGVLEKEKAHSVERLKYMLCRDCGRIPTADIIDKVSKIFGDLK